MSASANKGINTSGGQMQNEKRVETIDFRSSAGGQGSGQMQPVQVVHHLHPPTAATGPNTSGGVLANAAASVASTLQSAKDAISGK